MMWYGIFNHALAEWNCICLICLRTDLVRTVCCSIYLCPPSIVDSYIVIWFSAIVTLVGYFLRETDTPLRSGSFGSDGLPGLLTWGGEDASKYNDRIEKKRRSFARSGTFSSSYPSLATLGAPTAADFTIETDSATTPIIFTAQSSTEDKSSTALPLACQARPRRPMSGDITSTRRSLGSAAGLRRPRSRTDSTGPSEDLLQEAARTIAKVGDKIEADYKDDLTVRNFPF